MEISLPPIQQKQRTLLLIYNSGDKLREKELRDHIVKFLHNHSATEIRCYLQSSVYFNLKGETKTSLLKNLNEEFKLSITEFERENGVQVFWLFNFVFSFPAATNKKDKIAVGIAGRGSEIVFKESDKVIKELTKKSKLDYDY